LKLQEAQNKAESGSMGPSSSKKSFKAKAKTVGGKPIRRSGGGVVVGDIMSGTAQYDIEPLA